MAASVPAPPPRDLRSTRRFPRWCDLPSELLELVFMRPTLDSLDVLRCSSVCLAWRYTILNLRDHLHNVCPELLPCVLFLPSNRTNTAEVYRLNLPYEGFQSDVPPHQLLHCSYSHRGWYLVASDRPSNSPLRYNRLRQTFLYDPLSQALVKLPKCTPKVSYPFKFALSSRNCAAGTIVLCYNLPQRRFAFCILGKEETPYKESQWTLVQTVDPGLTFKCEDMVYHNGRFYAVTDDVDLVLVFELRGDYRGPTIHVKSLSTIHGLRVRTYIEYRQPVHLMSSYLVVLPTTATKDYKQDQLLMVARYGLEDIEKGSPRPRTSRFVVFRLEMATVTWARMHDFGGDGLALFLNHNDSFFLRTSDNAQCKRNSIYFVDDVIKRDEIRATEEMPLTKRGTDMGVFDLTTKTVEHFHNPPFNRWFVPNL